MKIILSGKNMEITDSLRDKVNRKVKKLERYFGPEIEAQVTLSVEKNRDLDHTKAPVL